MSDQISDQKLIDIASKRRAFLCQSAAVAASGTALAIASAHATAPETVQQTSDGSQRKGYRVTQHVLDYYKTASM